MKKFLWTIIILIVLGIGLWFVTQKTNLLNLVTINTWTQDQTTLANPASTNCKEKGGTVEIVIDLNGVQRRLCHLPDGTTCDEWLYYRGECIGNGATEESVQLQTGLNNENGIWQNTPTTYNIYKNSQVGFQFIYPKNCKITENLEKENDLKYSDCVIEVVVINNKEYLPLDAYLKNQMLLNSPTLSDELSENYVNTMLNTTEINHIETVKLSYFLFVKIDDNAVYITENLDEKGQYIFKKENYVVFITPHIYNLDGSPDSKIFEQIISSFKFEF